MSASVRDQRETTARFISDDEARVLFDEVAQRYLGISGEEFLRRWKHGDYAGDPDRPEVMRVAMLRHLAA